MISSESIISSQLFEERLLYNQWWDFTIVSNNNLEANSMNHIFKFRTQSCNITFPSFEIDSLITWEKKYKSVKFDGGINFSLFESESLDAIRYFFNWQKEIYNFEKMEFSTAPYKVKRDAYIDVTNANGILVLRFKAINLRLESIGAIEFTRANSMEPIMITVNTFCENIELLYSGKLNILSNKIGDGLFSKENFNPISKFLK